MNNAIASGDFIGDSDFTGPRYFVNGVVANADDVFDLSDLSLFDPSIDIDAGGVKIRGASGRQIYLADPLKTTMATEGYTIVMEVYFTQDGDFSSGVYNNIRDVNSLLFTQYAVGNPNNRHTEVQAWDFADFQEFDAAGDFPLPSQVNKVVFSITATYMSFSINGKVAQRMTAPGLDALATSPYFELAGGPDARLRRFTIYDIQPDAALPGLSAL